MELYTSPRIHRPCLRLLLLLPLHNRLDLTDGKMGVTKREEQFSDD